MKGIFRECRCVDVFGQERVCIPPQPGYACKRTCRVVKAYIVSMAMFKMRERKKRDKEVRQ